MELNEQQYNLYMQIARKYAANLPDEKDRIKAFKWLKKIHAADAKAAKTKNHALNILIICLQRKRLVGPFKIGPKDDKALTAYGWAYQPADIAKLILQQEFEKDGRPPISIEVSGNLSEFVAYQDIPDFGAQFFYAYSPEHIRKWDNLDKAVIPRGLLNVTVVSSPDTSILARSLEGKQKKAEEEYVCPGVDPEKPKPCPMKPKEEEKPKGPAKPAAKPAPKGRRIVKKRIVAKMPPLDTSRIEGPMNWVESREEYDARMKQEQMSRMPARLRQRLKQKPAAEDIIEEEGPCEQYVPPPPCGPPPAAPEAPCEPESPEMPGVVRTPELFYNKPRGPRREYKMDEFLLEQDEQFAPATDVFKGLEYEPPPPCEARRRSPVERRQPEMTPVREPPCPQPRSREVAESFERSYQAMMATREPKPPPPGLTPKHQAIWERLQKLKQAQLQPPRRLVFDEAEISVDQGNVSYEHMVYTEFPDEDKPPSILDDTAMGYSDVFGESRIAAVDALPAPAQADLDKAELLLEQEMETDELFGKSKLADPDVVFEDIAVEKEGDGPCAKKVTVGRRKLNVHGEEPLVESYMEESNEPLFDDTLKDDGDYTPPMTDSVLNVILDKKLKELQPTPPSPPCLPPVYGEWANEFMRGAERIERDEDVEQLSDISAPQYYSSDLETSAAATDPWERARRTGISPTRLALAQSVKASADFVDLRDRFRAQKGLSPVRERIEYPQMGEYLHYNELEVCEDTPTYYTAPSDYTDTDYIPPGDRSYFLESEMETDDVFGPRAVCEPSPVRAARLQAQTQRFEDIKSKAEVVRARRIHRDRAQRAFDEQDLLEPYHYQSFPEAGLGPLDSPIGAGYLESPLIQAPPSPPPRGGPLESFERQLDESLKFFEPVDSFSREGPCPFPDYDFLERRIYDEAVPAEQSFMAEDEMMTEDIFGEGAIGEPCPIQQLPAPTPPPPPPTTVSPVKYSHLYYVGTPPCKPGFRYKMTQEVLEDVSYPDEMLGEALEVSEEQVYPEVAPEEIAPEQVYQYLRLEQPPFEGEFDPDRECLAPGMMDTSDVFGEAAVTSPQRRRVSPTKLICARAKQQTDQIRQLRNRFRALKGLSPIPCESRDYEKMVEADGPELIGGLADAEYREPPFGIMDEPILEEGLPCPLMSSPKKKDPFESYEKTIFDSIFRDMVDAIGTPGDSVIDYDEMGSDPFAEGMIAEPVPVKDIAMPPASPPRRIYSHLYDDATPETPIPERYRPRIERLEEVSEPEYDSSFDRSAEPTPPQPPCPAPQEQPLRLPQMLPEFDAEAIKALAGTLTEDDVLEFLRMPCRQPTGGPLDETVLDRVLRRFEILRGNVPRPDDDFSILSEGAMPVGDMFGEDAMMAPGEMENTPTKALLAQSVAQSKRVEEMKNRARALRGLPPVCEERADPIAALKDREGHLLEPIKYDVQEAPFGIMDEPILEDQRPALIQSPQRTDPFESFERGLMHSWLQEIEEHDKSYEIPRDSEGNELDLSFQDMSFVKSPQVFPKFSTPAIKAREYGRAAYGRARRQPGSPCPQPGPSEEPMRSLVEMSDASRISDEPCPEDFEEYATAEGMEPCPEEFEGVDQPQLSAEVCPAEFSQGAQEILSPGAYPERFDLGEYAAEWPPRISAETFPDALIDSREYDTPCYDQPLSAESIPEDFVESEFEPPFVSSMVIFKEIGKEQTKRIHDLRNRYREQQGLPPLADLVDEEESIGEYHPDITPVDEPPCERLQFDFDSVERQFDESRRLSAERRIYGSPGQILSEGEMSGFDEEDICAPMPIREIPMPPAPPTPPPSPPVKYSHLYEMEKPPMRIYRYPREQLSDVPYPDDFYQTPPHFPESPERQLEDISEPDVFSRIEDFEESIYSLGDLTPSRAHKIGLSPTRLLLAQSVKASADYVELRDRFRELRGLPPVREAVDYPEMGEYLEYQDRMYDRYAPVEFPPHEPHLMDEPIWDELRPPLQPPRRDPFASMEEEMDEHPSMFYTASDGVLETDEMEDMFDSEMVEEPCPIGEIPMPPPEEEELDRMSFPSCDITPPPSPPVAWHLFNISSPYRRPVRGALPAERLDEESFPYEYDSPYDVCPEPTPPPCPSPTAGRADTPVAAGRLNTPIQIARAIDQSRRIADYKDKYEVCKARRIHRTGRPAPYTYQTPPHPGEMDDLLSPTEFGEFGAYETILDESLESGTYQTPLVGPPCRQLPDLQFKDSIGPPDIPDSPGGFNIKEVCPGYYVPAREKDRQRFAEFQKQYVAEQYGMDVADLSGEYLADISPPPSPMRTPGVQRPPSPPRGAAAPPPPCPRAAPAPPVCAETPARPRTPKRPVRPLQQRLDVCEPSPPRQARAPASPDRRLKEIFQSVASGAPQSLPIGMDPCTRIRRLMAQTPRFEVEALPPKSEYGPTEYITKMLPPAEDLLEEEDFPCDALPSDELYDTSRFGDYYHAMYIPTEQEELETQQRYAEQMAALESEICQPAVYPEPPVCPWPQASPCYLPDLSPSQEGFKWLDNFVPMEQNFPQPVCEPTPPPPRKSPAAVPAKKKKGPPCAKPLPPGKDKLKRPPAVQAPPPKKICKKLAASSSRLAQPKVLKKKTPPRPELKPEKKVISKTCMQASATRLSQAKKPPQQKPVCPKKSAPPQQARGKRPCPPSVPSKAAPPGKRPCPQARQGSVTRPPARQASATGQPARQSGAPARQDSVTRQPARQASATGQPARQSGGPARQPSATGQPARQSGAPEQKPCPPARQSGAPVEQPGVPGTATRQQPCPPARQTGARPPQPCPRQTGAPGKQPGPPGTATRQQPCPTARQAGPSAQRPGPPGQRPGPPGQRPGPPGQRPGPPGQRPGPPRQQPCPARRAGTPGQRPGQRPPGWQPLSPVAERPVSPYDVKRRQGMYGEIKTVLTGGPVPIVTSRNAPDLPKTGPRIYMPPEAIIEREKRLAQRGGRPMVYPPQPPQAGGVRPPPRGPSPTKQIRPAKTLSKSAVESVSRLAQPKYKPPCPAREKAAQAKATQKPPVYAGKRPAPANVQTPCPARSMQRAPPSGQRPPPGAPRKKAPERQAPLAQPAKLAPRQPVQPRAPSPPQQQAQIGPPRLPPRTGPLPPSIPLPLTGPIQNVLVGGPVPIVTTRNAPDVPRTGPRIYMPAEAILERQQRLGQRAESARQAQQAAAKMAERTTRDLQARAGIKPTTVKSSTSVSKLPGGRTAVVKKTSSVGTVCPAKGGPSRLSRQDKTRRR